MIDSLADRAAWIKSFKTIVCNTHKDLQPQKGRLSKNTDSASFEVEPHRDYATEMCLECRFEVSGSEEDTEALEKDAVRLIVLLAETHKSEANRVCEFLRSVFPAEYPVRLSKSGRRISITKSGLPTLDFTLPTSKQVENIKRYGERCHDLQRHWNSNVKELDKLLAAKAVSMA